MNIRSNSMRSPSLTPHQEHSGDARPSGSAPGPRRHTSVGVLAADAAAPAVNQTRWLTIGQQQVPVATQLEHFVLAQPTLPPGCHINAAQLSRALHEQAPELVSTYTQRFARDVGYALSALHNSDKRAYLGLTPARVQFIAPATFGLTPFAGERPLSPSCRVNGLPLGTPGYAPDDQLTGMSSPQDSALVAIDSFSWAANVCAFALGEPLVPVWPHDGEPKAWVKNILTLLDVDVRELQDADAKVFFAHWALDHACSLIRQADTEPVCDDDGENDLNPRHAALRVTLQTLGDPWPALPDRLGSLFPALMDYFDLEWRSRPRIESLLSELEVRQQTPAWVSELDLPQIPKSRNSWTRSNSGN